MIQWRKIISFDFHHIPKLSIGFNHISATSSADWHEKGQHMGGGGGQAVLDKQKGKNNSNDLFWF